jgi:hypothetical protein
LSREPTWEVEVRLSEEEGGKVAKLPKLKIKNYFKRPLEEKICDLEKGEGFLRDYLPEDYGTSVLTAVLVAVEGELIHSYDELTQIAKQDFYKDREFLKVVIHPAFGGG